MGSTAAGATSWRSRRLVIVQGVTHHVGLPEWEIKVNWTEGYVDFGYTHDFYRELTPALHRFALLSRGIDPGDRDLDRIAYCELGCGHGYSTMLLAAGHPQAEFHANDFLPGHIAYAQKLTAEAGITNATFYDDSFEEFLHRDLPQFDAIVLHGIYSWVSDENRRHVVDFIARKLKVGGIVYVSYNCYPGWATMAPLRQLMVMFAGNSSEPLLPRIDKALTKIQRLFETNSMYARANPLLKDRFDGVQKQARAYIAHEYFNNDWNIFYHTDVARELRDAKLDYATTVEVLEHLDNFNLTAEQQAMLAEIGNTDQREVMHDFITNRQFRRDLYIKGRLPIESGHRNARLMATRFVLSTAVADIPRSVLTPLGRLGLSTAVFDPLIEFLSRGPATLGQCMEEDALRAVGFPTVLEAVTILVGQSHLQPCLPASGDAERMESTSAFNTVVLERALHSNELQFLASPLTGGGFQIGRFDQLFLLAVQRNLQDPASFVAECLVARGEVLVRDGQALQTAEENLAFLRERYAVFVERTVPVLKQLGIAR
jgi:SAM-dependent methyltransferase